MRILFVCDDNRIASPMAAAFLYQESRRRRLDLTVASAGFMSEGEPVVEQVVQLLADRSVDLTRKQSRRVTARLMRPADLVLTMTEAQASSLRETHPDHAPRIGTLGAARTVAGRDDPTAWLSDVRRRFGPTTPADPSLDITLGSQVDFDAILQLADRVLADIGEIATAVSLGATYSVSR